MNRRVFAIVFALLLGNAVAFAQKPSSSVVVLSVGDILGNYGLDSAWVNDTSAVIAHLNAQPQDYVALTNLCVSIRTNAERAINSIERDYDHRDSLIWIDSATVISDYSIYEYRLRRLRELMGRMSIRYSRLEQQRIEAEKEAARQRAVEQARREQDERDRIAADLRSSIEVHHRSIITACDGAGITDRTQLKDLKDLSYSYLMVYNKYDLSSGPATHDLISRLDELNAFQTDLLDNVLGHNSLPYQIENFKNVLKLRCEKDNNDVYRSYTKVFKRTAVPISFADIAEYEDYISRMQTMINVQQRYLQTLDFRATIASGSAAIEQLYGKRYKAALASYREVLHSINMLPAFTTNAESIRFIQDLDAFVAAQQTYIDDYTYLEEISARSDTIIRRCGTKLSDVANTYRSLESMLVPLPAFKDPAGALHYQDQLDAVVDVQRCYLEVIDRRMLIARLDDTLSATRKADRVLYNGYRLLSRQTDLKPSFATLDRGQLFLADLQRHIEMQRLCVLAMRQLDTIATNARTITQKDQPYRNIARAYSRMEKVYQAVSEINNLDDLRRYQRQCAYLIRVQEAFFKLMRSEYANENDNRLRREDNIDNIRIMLGLE